MKTKTLFLTCLLVFVSSMTVSGTQSLVVWHSDGSTTVIELYNQPLVQFAGDKVLITSPVINLEYDKSDVIRFTYKDMDTNISTPEAGTNIEQKNGQIIFHNVSPTDNVAVYNTNGVRVPVRFSLQGGNAVLSLSQIPSGVYLFNINGRTSKFTKK